MAKLIMCCLNVFYALCGLGIACAGAFYFVHIYELMNLRNDNHYKLDYTVYWVQVLPWLFILIGLTVAFTAWCGFCAYAGKRRGTLFVYIILLGFTISSFVALTALVFIYGDSENTRHFIEDTILDAFQNAGTNNNFDGYNQIERKYHCCGGNNPTDYKRYRNDLPLSCCDEELFAPGKRTCEFTDYTANDKFGCAKVVKFLAKHVLIYIAVGAIFVAIVQLICFICAIKKYVKPKEKKMTMQDYESKKVLL